MSRLAAVHFPNSRSQDEAYICVVAHDYVRWVDTSDEESIDLFRRHGLFSVVPSALHESATAEEAAEFAGRVLESDALSALLKRLPERAPRAVSLFTLGADALIARLTTDLPKGEKTYAIEVFCTLMAASFWAPLQTERAVLAALGSPIPRVARSDLTTWNSLKDATKKRLGLARGAGRRESETAPLAEFLRRALHSKGGAATCGPSHPGRLLRLPSSPAHKARTGDLYTEEYAQYMCVALQPRRPESNIWVAVFERAAHATPIEGEMANILMSLHAAGLP